MDWIDKGVQFDFSYDVGFVGSCILVYVEQDVGGYVVGCDMVFYQYCLDVWYWQRRRI